MAPKFENVNYEFRNMQFPIGLNEMRAITLNLSWFERNFYNHIVGIIEK